VISGGAYIVRFTLGCFDLCVVLMLCHYREKFVQFEAYAEKLSAEAIDLRTKINKEQRESRRLTSIVTMTAQEKAKLQARTSSLQTFLMI
jgi:hypothetical protein